MTVTRRQAIETIGKTTAVAAVAVPVAAQATEHVDPHVEWYKQSCALKARAFQLTDADDEEEIDCLWNQAWELETKIIETPAKTPEAFLVKIDIIDQDLDAMAGLRHERSGCEARVTEAIDDMQAMFKSLPPNSAIV